MIVTFESLERLRLMFSLLSGLLGKRKRSDDAQAAEEPPRPAASPRPAARAQPVEYKLVLVGDGGVGKTTLVKRHLLGEFATKYIPTLGVEVTALRFETNCGPIVFNVWDTAGQEKFGGLRDGYYVHSQCALVMFDVSSRITYQNVPQWFDDVKRACGAIPSVLVGNKVDVKERALKAQSITYHKKRGIAYYDVSAKNQFNFEKPFLYLARQLTGKRELQFIGNYAREPQAPPAMDAGSSRAVVEQLEAARRVAIDDADDDL